MLMTRMGVSGGAMPVHLSSVSEPCFCAEAPLSQRLPQQLTSWFKGASSDDALWQDWC